MSQDARSGTVPDCGSSHLAARTDRYFLKSREIVRHFGDRHVAYAIFMRRPMISSPRLLLDFLDRGAPERNARFDWQLNHSEGRQP